MLRPLRGGTKIRSCRPRTSAQRSHAIHLRRNASSKGFPKDEPTKSKQNWFSRYVPDSATLAYGTFGGVLMLLGGHIFTRYFFSFNACEGISMLPSFNSFGDWILISKHYRRGRGVEVGDVVSFKHPVEEETRAIKRVLGMPGDIVCRDTPGVGEKLVQVPQGHCWVVGDNLAHSRDSRLFGPLPLALVRGKVTWRYSTSPSWWTLPEAVKNPLHDLDEDD